MKRRQGRSAVSAADGQFESGIVLPRMDAISAVIIGEGPTLPQAEFLKESGD